MSMNPGMRMLMMQRAAQGNEPRRSEYGGSDGRRMIGYDRDADRERTDNRSYPVRRYAYDNYDMAPESRRRRDRNGRFMMGEQDYYGEYPSGRSYRPARNHYKEDDDDEEDEDDSPRYSRREKGGNTFRHHGEVDERTAMMWVEKMKGADGTTGAKYKPEQAEQMRTAHCPECKKWEFYVAVNMMYADYCAVAKKLGVDKPDFYAHMAKAFLCDEDAGEHKLEKYMETIPK